MIRVVAVASLLLFAVPALAQQADGGAAAGSTPSSGSTSPSTSGAASPQDIEAIKRDLMEAARREADERVERAKEEMRNEVRAELATQSANRSWEEEWQEQKKKLELFEINGYLRVRPTLLNDMDLDRGPDPEGNTIFPRPLNDPDPTKSRTLTWADMRLRAEPILNISEDIRLRGQFDVLSNLILGSTPELDSYYPIQLMSFNQISPANAILVRRVYAEVNTPVGLLSFGRMGDHFGLGMMHNDGNCLDCDYGDTVDRVQFVAKLVGFYFVPMIDFQGKGPTTSIQGQNFAVGQPIDLGQGDDVVGPLDLPVLSIMIAKRDTDKEAQRKIDNGENVINYGVYFSYRHQTFESVNAADTNLNNTSVDPTNTGSGYATYDRTGELFLPDVWFKFQNKRLRIEAEVAGVFGSLEHRNLVPTSDPTNTQRLTLTQLGAVAQGSYKFLDGALSVNLEAGFASGDNAPGMGNRNVLGNTPTVPGDVDGPQFNCSTLNCSDSSINNFRFNRDYRVDLILWREILNGVTDAIYVKPGVKYQIVEGVDVFANVIYSRTVFAASAPGGDPNLGVEIDPGVSYTTDDGFVASLQYGALIPLKGLSNPPNSFHTTTVDAQVAHALRAMLAVKF
jgi:uncharacterized protein (TIGR04551 family)